MKTGISLLLCAIVIVSLIGSYFSLGKRSTSDDAQVPLFVPVADHASSEKLLGNLTRSSETLSVIASLGDSSPALSVASGAKPARRDKPLPPIALVGFWDWSAARRLEVVSLLQTEHELPKEILSFFRMAILDRDLDETIRNNLANALLVQDQHDPEIYNLFISMIMDRQEPYVWREYALQHLAVAAHFSSDRAACERVLRDQFERGELAIPGTAALHLHRLNQAGLVNLDTRFFERLRAVIADRHQDILTRMTAVGICRERQDVGARPTLREATKDPSPSMRRVAIAAMGVIGAPDDAKLLQAALHDPDPTVALAARAANAVFFASSSHAGR